VPGSRIDQNDPSSTADRIAYQLGRRNLTPDQASLVRGRIYNRAKKAKGFQEPGPGRGKTLDQNDPVFSESTADRLAKQHGVSAPTIKRDGKFAEALEKVKAIDPDIEKKVAAGTAPSKATVVKAAKLVEKDPEAAKAVLQEKRTKKREPRSPLAGGKSVPHGSWANTNRIMKTLSAMKAQVSQISRLRPDITSTTRITEAARDVVAALNRFIGKIERR